MPDAELTLAVWPSHRFGLGTWQAKPGEVGAAVAVAIRLGYRLLDCAWIYDNEAEVGVAIKDAIESGIVTRAELFIVTKLWSASHRHDQVRPALEDSLRKLQVDYVDLYLIHNPVTMLPDADGDMDWAPIGVPIAETWRGMEGLVDAGLARAIGVSNFGALAIYDLLAYARIKPVVNQIERHPYLVQDKLVQWCAKNGVHTMAYSPLGNPSFSKHSNEGALPRLIDVEAIKAIGRAHHKSAAQVLLRWGVQVGSIVIPKSVSEARLRENANIFDFELSADEVLVISALDKNFRYLDFTFTTIPIFA